MRFKCMINEADFKQYGCTTDIVIENVESVNFIECGDYPMVEIKYYNLEGHECYTIMPIRGINYIKMEEQ